MDEGWGDDLMPNWKFEWFDRVDRVGEAINGASIATGTTTIVNLSSPPFNVLFRTFSGDAPPFNPINQNVPLTPGSYLKFMDTQENEVDLVLRITVDPKLATTSSIPATREALYNIIAGSQTNGVSLPNLFSPVKPDILATLKDPPAKTDVQRILTGFGKLRVTTPALLPGNTEIVRDLICRCTSGFKIRNSDLQIKSMFCPLTFYANDPYWRKSTRNSFDLGPMAFPPSSLPVPPPWFAYLDSVTIGAGAKYEKKFSINNTGDVSAYPIWTVFGPGINPYFQNLRTGQILSFGSATNPLVIGMRQALVINVENRTAQISGGPDVVEFINVSSQWWEFLTNSNNITVRVHDGNTSDTRVSNQTHVKVEYYERYLGAY